VPWLTAHYAALCDGPVAGRTVLVAGGTGAVGYYAVQIAKHEGARVIATVGSADSGTAIIYGAGGTEGVISAGWDIQNQPTIKFIYMYKLPAQAYARAVAEFEVLQSAGKLKHLPVREFRLEQISQAHEAVEKGNSGTRMMVMMT
jgi:NADPH:quinone reductase-like Zn-dependent oxidoreductase